MRIRSWWTISAAILLTVAIYWPGLHGAWLFDDYPNIVDNKGVQPTDASVPSLVRAALSSPSSEFKRPLASLSFAANYLASGLAPFWWKLTNLVIHLLNGVLVFWLARLLMRVAARRAGPCLSAGAHFVREGSAHAAGELARRSRMVFAPAGASDARITGDRSPAQASRDNIAAEATPAVWPAMAAGPRIDVTAVLIAGAWMLLPINLTAVLYVVQRMESIANAFVLLGLIGYVIGRRRMLAYAGSSAADSQRHDIGPSVAVGADEAVTDERPRRAADRWWRRQRGFLLCVFSITIPAALGLLAKETAVMLPLYALLIEWALFHFCGRSFRATAASVDAATRPRDARIIGLFIAVLALPMAIGLAWIGPRLLDPAAWATRDFTLGTRLLSEARIVVDYIGWTLLPTPGALSFYHDDFQLSTGLLTPWTTLASIVCLIALVIFSVWIRARRPLVALGIALFLGCQLLTGTVLPLELIYEHRNYFASFGLLLALIPILAAPARAAPDAARRADTARHRLPNAPSDPKPAGNARPTSSVAAPVEVAASTGEVAPMDVAASARAVASSVAGEAVPSTLPTATASVADSSLAFALPRYVLLAGLLLSWTALTAFTAYAWGNPLRLAQDLALRAPLSPRAQYELGRSYIIYSRYDPASPFTPLVYAPLERSAALPGSSILPEQALIFMNSRMHLPLKDVWWDSLIAKLKAHPPGVQDDSSLAALTQCAREGHCDLPADRMVEAFTSALSHPNPGARLLATYGDYAWNVLDDHPLGERMTREAVQASPDEPAYQITLIRMLAAQGRHAEAVNAIKQLATLNIGGRLNSSLTELRKLPHVR